MWKLLLRSIITIVFFVIPFCFSYGFFVFADEFLLSEKVFEIKIEEFEIQNNTSPVKEKKIPLQNFNLGIPKINLDKKVEPNIDPRSLDEYGPVLERNLAHGKYTLFPDQVYEKNKGITYIFGHRYGEHGYLSRLGELELGDLVYVEYDGHVFEYKIISKNIVGGGDTSVYNSKSSYPLLRIQTCENGESERLIIDAIMIMNYDL